MLSPGSIQGRAGVRCLYPPRRFNFDEGTPPTNFDTFPAAIMTVFQVRSSPGAPVGRSLLATEIKAPVQCTRGLLESFFLCFASSHSFKITGFRIILVSTVVGKCHGEGSLLHLKIPREEVHGGPRRATRGKRQGGSGGKRRGNGSTAFVALSAGSIPRGRVSRFGIGLFG